MSSNAGTVGAVAKAVGGGVAVSVAEVSGLSISGPLAPAAEAGGGAERGGDTGPVGVGVVDGGQVAVVAGLGLSLGGGDGRADGNSKDLEIIKD